MGTRTPRLSEPTKPTPTPNPHPTSRKKDKKQKKDKKAKGDSSSSSSAAAGAVAGGNGGEMRVGGVVVPTYDELFKATGGKRLGAWVRSLGLGWLDW